MLPLSVWPVKDLAACWLLLFSPLPCVSDKCTLFFWSSVQLSVSEPEKCFVQHLAHQISIRSCVLLHQHEILGLLALTLA